MDAILIQILNGLDKGAAYALIALGLTLAFGTLGIVNFAHGALFTLFDAYKEQPYLEIWFGDFGAGIVDFAVPLSIIFAIPVMILIGIAMERGLIKHFYKRTHAEQILVTFGLAIVIQEIIKHFFGANPIPAPAPDIVAGSAAVGSFFGLSDNLVYPWWRLIYIVFAAIVIFAVFAFLKFTTFGMVVRAGMADRETFVVVVVGGMGSLGGAVLAGFLLGILQSFASMNEVKSIIPGIDQIIIYLVAIVVLLVRPRGLMGREGVFED